MAWVDLHVAASSIRCTRVYAFGALMTDAAGNWHCYVGTYEIWPWERLPAKVRKHESDSKFPYLVQIGPAQRVKPPREAYDMAVLRLLKTKLPEPTPRGRTKEIEIMAEVLRRGGDRSFAYLEADRRRAKSRERAPKQADYADIEKSVLAIASRIGMLWLEPELDIPPSETQSLEGWVNLADEIQAIFRGREVSKGLPKELATTPFAQGLQLQLVYKADSVSMHLTPSTMDDLLIHHAAHMITRGTTLADCEQCHSPFLTGGDARGGGKRRRDARFCSNQCRYAYHNEQQRRSRKRKL